MKLQNSLRIGTRVSCVFVCICKYVQHYYDTYNAE